MRLDRLLLRGLSDRFPKPVEIPLREFDPGLVALCGPNGSGKTMLLEALALVLYQRLPSRAAADNVYEFIPGGTAWVEAAFTDGDDALVARADFDAARKTTEVYLRVNGEPVTSGKVGEMKAAVAERFGSYDLLLSSVLAAQSKRGNFIKLSRAERKERFVEMLGLARLQAMHERAKARRAALVAEVDQARAARAALGDRPDLESLREGLRLQEQALRDRVAEADTATDEAIAATRERDRLDAEALRFADLSRDLDQARVARAAVEPPEEYARRREQAQRAHDQACAALRAALPEDPRPAAERELARIDERIAAFEAELEPARAAAEEAAGLPRARDRYDRLAAARRAAVARAAAIEEAERGAALLEEAPCAKAQRWVPDATLSIGPARAVALADTCPLLSAAQDARRKLDAFHVEPAPVAPTEAELDGARAEIERLVSLAAAGDRAAGIATSLERSRGDRRRWADGLEALGARHAAKLEEASRSIERAGLDLAGRLEALGEQAAAAARKRTELDATIEKLDLRLAGLPDQADLVAARAAADAAEQVRHRAENARMQAADALGSCRVRLEAAVELDGKIDALAAVERAACEELEHWELLADGLGPNGMQALLVDAASPEVTGIANELLATCYSGRFTVEFRTLRAKRTGGHAEDFSVRVFDAGHERNAESLSGGEQVILSEAIGLAIAIFNARRSGVRWETLIRDETAGALDPSNAAHYIEMLRRARVLGGFRHVVYVAHLPEVTEAADVRLYVGGGAVRAVA